MSVSVLKGDPAVPPKAVVCGHHDVYEQQLDVQDAVELAGLDALLLAGVRGRHFGRHDGSGPFFYILEQTARTEIPRHLAKSVGMFLLLEGSWEIGEPRDSAIKYPGYFRFQRSAIPWGPVRAGSSGARFLAYYMGRPSLSRAADTLTDSSEVAHECYEQAIDWTPVKDLYGFGGADVQGSSGKYLGIPGSSEGPWFYFVKHVPHTRVPRHTHGGNVAHLMLDGYWQVGDDWSESHFPGYFHYESKGLFWGPLRSGGEGSKIIAIYDECPSFIPAEGNEAGYVDPWHRDAGTRRSQSAAQR